MSELIESPLAQPSFWQLPLAERMALFAEIREQGPFVPVEFENPMQGLRERFYAVTRYDEVVEISRRPQDFCSGKGAVSIPDMPVEALDFFGSFINMDDPRHARQRGIVARSFTPRQLQGVLDSVETICTEVIDGFCEQGEVDLVEVMSQPFPLLVICDMMGIPRSEFQTVLDATNVILGGGDPEYIGDRDVMTAIFEAGMQLTALMNELAEQRRARPDRRPHLEARLQRPRGGHARAPGDRAVLHPPRRGRQRHDPHRDQPRDEPAVAEPRPTAHLAGRPRGRDLRGGRGDRPGRLTGDLHASHRHPRPHPVGAGLRGGRQGRAVLRRRQPRPAASSRTRRPSMSVGTPTLTSASAARVRTSAWVRTSLVASCRSCSVSSSPACPTSR